MFYPQGNFYSQGNLGYPQGGIGYPQIGSPQGGFGHPQLGIGYPQGGFVPQVTPYFPQGFAQSPPQVPNWQHPAQQLTALQQQALLQLLAPQLAAQSPAFQHPAGISGPGISGMNGIANGAGQSVGGWQQSLPNPEQINPAVLQPQQQLQRLAQYHFLLAQQFVQLAAQQVAHNPGNPYAGQFVPGTGQFIPSQLGANFVPGITMH